MKKIKHCLFYFCELECIINVIRFFFFFYVRWISVLSNAREEALNKAFGEGEGALVSFDR